MKASRHVTVVRYLAFLGGIVLALGAGCGIFYLHTFAPRIVARAKAPNGLELYVIQRGAAPFSYNTGIRYRKPDGISGGFYYDHEDSRWRRGQVALDSQSRFVTVFREGQPVILFDSETAACSVRHGGFRQAQAEQPGWSPPFWNPFSW